MDFVHSRTIFPTPRVCCLSELSMNPDIRNETNLVMTRCDKELLTTIINVVSRMLHFWQNTRDNIPCIIQRKGCEMMTSVV